MTTLSLDEAYRRFVVDAPAPVRKCRECGEALGENDRGLCAECRPTTRIALAPIDPATVERRRLVAVLNAEYDFIEAFGTASDDTQVRYHKVHEALTAAGVTLARPGTLTKRIAATLALGDELARVLQAEMRYAKAHEDCEIHA